MKDILFQVINHSTYHRAQIATEFKNSGILSSDELNLFVFSNKHLFMKKKWIAPEFLQLDNSNTNIGTFYGIEGNRGTYHSALTVMTIGIGAS